MTENKIIKGGAAFRVLGRKIKIYHKQNGEDGKRKFGITRKTIKSKKTRKTRKTIKFIKFRKSTKSKKTRKTRKSKMEDEEELLPPTVFKLKKEDYERFQYIKDNYLKGCERIIPISDIMEMIKDESESDDRHKESLIRMHNQYIQNACNPAKLNHNYDLKKMEDIMEEEARDRKIERFKYIRKNFYGHLKIEEPIPEADRNIIYDAIEEEEKQKTYADREKMIKKNNSKFERLAKKIPEPTDAVVSSSSKQEKKSNTQIGQEMKAQTLANGSQQEAKNVKEPSRNERGLYTASYIKGKRPPPPPPPPTTKPSFVSTIGKKNPTSVTGAVHPSQQHSLVQKSPYEDQLAGLSKVELERMRNQIQSQIQQELTKLQYKQQSNENSDNGTIVNLLAKAQSGRKPLKKSSRQTMRNEAFTRALNAMGQKSKGVSVGDVYHQITKIKQEQSAVGTASQQSNEKSGSGEVFSVVEQARER